MKQGGITSHTLTHELVHAEQHHYGHPSRNGYHNRQFAELMQRIGLMPSDTGEPGGKQTGQQMSDYPIKGGRFERVCPELLASGWRLDWGDYETPAGDGKGDEGKLLAARKIGYRCPQCGVSAWAKPKSSLICGKCCVALQ